MKRPLTILVLLLLAHPAVAADKWLSIHSKNFQLIGNSSEAEVRRAGRVLEEFRTALAMMFPKMDQTSPVPVTVIVFKNDEAMKPYKPLYQGNPSNALAFFQPGEDVNYIVVTPLAQPSAILHEYVHFLLRQNVGSLPLWVTEGFAEAYSTFELGNKPNDFAIGRAPDRHVAMLNDPAAKFIPMKRFITIQQNSPEYNEDSKQGMFYAQSWAYVHYLILGAEGKRRTQFVQLLTALSRGEPFEDSFGDAFQTDYGTLEDEVRDYVRKRSSWPVMKVTGKEGLQIDVRAINTATLSEAESEFYLGDLLLHLNRTDDAEPHLAAAVAKAPTLSGAQSSLALLRVRQKKYDEALSLLKKAADADSKNPMINFYYAYVLDRADSDASASLAGNSADRYETMRTYAKRSMELAPKFIEGYALLARINLNAGEHLDEAENALKKGLQLAPGRDDMRMLLAQTYLREDRTADARGVLSIIERSTNDADLRKRATTMLDRTEQTFTFTEITAGIEKELEKERAAERAANPPPPPPASSPKETVIEALTPTAPAVEGEKVTGLLINLDCAAGLTLRVRTADRGTLEFHSAQPEKIQFLSYTADVANNINCGPRNPGTPVSITFRAQADGAREPLVVEFMQK